MYMYICVYVYAYTHTHTHRYTLDAREADSFMHAHDEFLILVAAGNAGPALMTVGSPATAKNALAVGASENSIEAYPVSSLGLYVALHDGGGAASAGDSRQYMLGVQADFGPVFSYGRVFARARLVGVDDALGCAALKNAAAIRGNVALVRRGECFFKTKVQLAQEAGALAVVVTNNPNEGVDSCAYAGDGECDEPSFCPEGTDVSDCGRAAAPLVMGDTEQVPAAIGIPALMVGSVEGEVLWAAVRESDSGGVQARVTLPLPPEGARMSPDTLAGFSARGPTLDTRVKPDVVAPGEAVWSARSDGDPGSRQCGADPRGRDHALTVMSGTCMCTYMYAYTCMYVCMHICVYMYVCMYV